MTTKLAALLEAVDALDAAAAGQMDALFTKGRLDDLRAAAADLRAEMEEHGPDAIRLDLCCLCSECMELRLQQAAEEALRPIQECGVPISILEVAAGRLIHFGLAADLRIIHTALRKALDGPERPSDSPG